MTTQRAELDDLPLTFGKHKGKTPLEVCEIDPQYVIWMYANVKPEPCSKELAEACEQDERELDSEYHDLLMEWMRK